MSKENTVKPLKIGFKKINLNKDKNKLELNTEVRSID